VLIYVVGHFDEWQLIFYGTNSTPVRLLDSPQRRTKPTVASNATLSATSTSTANVSTSTVATTLDSVAISNLTFGAHVTTAPVADAGVTTTSKLVAEQPTATNNFSFGSSSSSSNVSVVKNLTVKDSDAENSTVLKSGAVINGTFVTLPPAVVPGFVSDAASSGEHGTGSNVTLVDSPVSDTQNASVIFDSANVTGSNGTYQSASVFSVPVTRPAVVANVTLMDTGTADHEASADYTDAPVVVESTVPRSLYGEVFLFLSLGRRGIILASCLINSWAFCHTPGIYNLINSLISWVRSFIESDLSETDKISYRSKIPV